MDYSFAKQKKKKKKRFLYTDYLYSTLSEKSEYDRTSRSSSLYHHQEWSPFRAIKVHLKQHMYKSRLSITGMQHPLRRVAMARNSSLCFYLQISRSRSLQDEVCLITY